MKKIQFLLILLLFTGIRCNANDTVRLVIMHPTVYNIEYMQFLLKEKILELPEIELIAFYNTHEAYDFKESQEFVREKQIKNIRFVESTEKVELASIFKNNSNTALFKKIVASSDGVIFFGGPDLPPSIYNEKTALTTIISDPYRHFFEVSFLFHLLGGYANEAHVPFLKEKPNYMVLGICLGMQSINVATGGTLIQDIPSEIYKITDYEKLTKTDPDKLHRLYNSALYPNENYTNRSFHKIYLVEGGLFEKMGVDSKSNPKVNSYHHQCVQRLGKGLKAEAYSMDYKVMEAFSHAVYKNVVGFQFHPEKMEQFYPDESYRLKLNEIQEKNYYELLKESNSLEFHYKLWKYIANILSETKR